MKKKSINKYIPIVILFILLLVLHLFMQFAGDDIWFSQVKNLITFIPQRYQDWSSRIIIESIFIVLVKMNVNWWRILDTIIFIVGIMVALKLVNNKKINDITFYGCCLFLMYPFTDLSSAGWGATTVNYLWCFGLGMLSFLPLINYEQHKKTNKLVYAISILALIYAGNQEQSCAIILGINILYLINKFMKKEKLNKYNIVCIIIALISLGIIVCCPGNKVRMIKETTRWFPAFAKCNILDKTYLGIVPTMGILLNNKIIIAFFASILLYATIIYSKHSYTKLIATITTTLVFLFSIFKNILIDIFPSFESVVSALQISGPPLELNYASCTAFLISVLIILGLIYMMLVVFKRKNLLPLFILLAGIASRFIIGFSPTIFASSTRTAIFLYMSIIIVTLFIIYKLYEDKKISQRSILILKCITFITALLNYINTFLTI